MAGAGWTKLAAPRWRFAGTQALGDLDALPITTQSSLSSLSCMPEQAGIKHRGVRGSGQSMTVLSR